VRRALALSDRQLRFVEHGAASLPVLGRDLYLRRVAALLGDDPGDFAVQAAVNIALDMAAVVRCEEAEAVT
jgi:hypothetical protein